VTASEGTSASDALATIRARRERIFNVARRYGVSNVRVFGSVVRGEEDAGSEIDFLVDLEKGRSLLDLGGLAMDLSDLLEREVDVVTEKGLRERVRSRVLAEAQPL
jgi:hypothetical protein